MLHILSLMAEEIHMHFVKVISKMPFKLAQLLAQDHESPDICI